MVQRNWGRDVERDAWGAMAEDWTPRFRESQGFRVGGCEERRAGQRARAYPAAMTPRTQPYQQRQAYR